MHVHTRIAGMRCARWRARTEDVAGGSVRLHSVGEAGLLRRRLSRIARRLQATWFLNPAIVIMICAPARRSSGAVGPSCAIVSDTTDARCAVGSSTDGGKQRIPKRMHASPVRRLVDLKYPYRSQW